MKNNNNLGKIITILLIIAFASFTIASFNKGFRTYKQKEISKKSNFNVDVKDGVKVNLGDFIKVDVSDKNVNVKMNGVEVANFSNNSSYNNLYAGKNNYSSNENIKINQEKEIKSKNNLTIESSSSDIEIIFEKRDTIKAHYYGKRSESYSEPELIVKSFGNEISIYIKYDNNFNYNGSISTNLDIYVPLELNGNLKVNSSSGNIYFDNTKLNEVDVSASSGDIEISNIEAEFFKIDSSSGSIIANNIISDIIEIESSSGDQTLDSIDCKSFEGESSSGSISLKNVSGKLNLDTSSGDINIWLNKLSNNIYANTSSGSVKIYVPENKGFYLSLKTNSGDLSCQFPISINETDEDYLKGTYKNKKYKIIIETSSGDIDIYRK